MPNMNFHFIRKKLLAFEKSAIFVTILLGLGFSPLLCLIVFYICIQQLAQTGWIFPKLHTKAEFSKYHVAKDFVLFYIN
jgi:hypothetical protein